jgi:hypothetical protein
MFVGRGKLNMRGDVVMRRVVLPLMALLVVGLTAAAALAGSPHLRKGSGISCTIGTSGTFPNDQVTCTGTGGMAGLGNGDVKFVLSGTGDASYFCVNPSGTNEPKGQNKVPTSIPPDSETVPGSSVKNGNLSFFGPDGNTLGPITATPVNATGKEAGCPSGQWTTRVDAIFWTSVTISVEQPAGTPILSCTKSDPAGLTGTFSLSCS